MATVTESSLRVWDALTGSPVLRASTPSNTSSAAYPRAESISSMDLDDHEHDHFGSGMKREACDCDSVIDVFDELDEFVLMCFERVHGSKGMIAPNGKRIHNWNPVVPMSINADAVKWCPLLDSRGNDGHRFVLNRHGVEQAKIEVFTTSTEIVKIVVVHSMHTRLAHHSGAVANCSILKFATPAQHVDKLRAVVNNSDTMYLPVKELVVAAAFHALPLECACGFESHASASVAGGVWHATKQALETISALTRTHIDAHNRAEFHRKKTSAFVHKHRKCLQSERPIMLPSLSNLSINRGSEAAPESYQDILVREGVVVVPTPLVDRALRTQTQQEFFRHVRESPEFKDPDPDDPNWRPSLGGFAAMANPSSFHHPWVRKLREQMTAAVLESDAIPIEGRKLEKTFDRLMYRTAGQTPTAESMHRDISPMALSTDVVFGGWVNLDHVDQFFSCAPRTHSEVPGQNSGFALIKTDEEKAKYRPLFETIAIPPGHCMIFYERLVHEVLAKRATVRMLRMHLGWRVTDADDALFDEKLMKYWIEKQGVPKLKSGQDPPVWPSAYSNYPKNFQTLTDWSTRTFVEQCVDDTLVGGKSEYAGTYMKRVSTKMKSLSEYGLTMHKAYDEHERKLLYPSRAWNLYTFDSPNERVEFASPSPEDWKVYMYSTEAAMRKGGTAPRPGPYRV